MITGEDIRIARIKSGKTQAELADEMDISQRKLSRLENNEHIERYDKFLQLISTLGLYQKVEDSIPSRTYQNYTEE